MYRFFVLLLLSGCLSPSSWYIDAIAAGDLDFDSARLCYLEQERTTPLNFELLRIGQEVLAYLSLSQFRFQPTSALCSEIEAKFQIREKTFYETLPVLEGKMRLRLSSEMTERVIHALQEGQEIVILIDGFEKRLKAESFSKMYDKWVGSAAFLNNPIKGPI